MLTTTYSPRHQVIIRRTANQRKDEDISSDVLAISTHKSYGQPMGAFTIVTTFRPAINGKRYDEIVKPNDIVLIKLDEGSGRGLVPVMLGLVNACERSRMVSPNGEVTRTVLISGADFGKVLTRHYARWYTAPTDDHVGSEEAQTTAQYGAALMAGGTPDVILKKLIDVELFRVMPWVAEHILTDTIAPIPNAWSRPIVTYSMQSPLWSVLQQYADTPFNQLHADTGNDGKYHIILEKCPFDDKTGKLTRSEWFEIDTPDIISEKIGVNDYDRINYIWYKVQCSMFGEVGGNPLLYLKGDAIRYGKDSVASNGFMPWYPSTEFVPFTNVTGNPVPPQLTDSGSQANVRRPVKERTEAIWNWYKDNHTYESGTFLIHGKPEVRAGGAIINKETGNEYLIEQITHQYSVWPRPKFNTSIHVTRGQKHGPN